MGDLRSNHPELFEPEEKEEVKKTLLIDEYDTDKKIIEKENRIDVYGGDGTMLRAVNLFRGKGKPFFGIARGTLNFLMNREVYPTEENLKIKKFRLIKINIKYKLNHDNHEVEYQAFNDIMIGKDMNSWIDFNVKDKDNIIGEFKGGGLIVSTSQGSTGINKNNGGIILPLSSTNWVITGDKCNRTIKAVVEPKRTKIEFKARHSIFVWVDGHQNIIENAHEVEISSGDVVELMFNNFDEFKAKRR